MNSVLEASNSDKNLEFLNLYFYHAVKSVISSMAGLDVSVKKLLAEDVGKPSNQISGAILLSGDKNILITIGMLKDTASKLISGMTGMQQMEITNEDLVDGTAELVNMIAGQLRLQLAKRGNHYMVSPPFTIIGDSHAIVHKSKQESIVKKYSVANMEIILEAIFM